MFLQPTPEKAVKMLLLVSLWGFKRITESGAFTSIFDKLWNRRKLVAMLSKNKSIFNILMTMLMDINGYISSYLSAL